MARDCERLEFVIGLETAWADSVPWSRVSDVQFASLTGFFERNGNGVKASEDKAWRVLCGQAVTIRPGPVEGFDKLPAIPACVRSGPRPIRRESIMLGSI